MAEKLGREECLKLLEDKAENMGRLPKKSDFTDWEVQSIKNFFGPWPRALEAAGVKEPRNEDKLLKNKEKRIKSKIRKRNDKL